VASSESSAAMLKGSPSGEVSRYRVRSMFLLSSIATALKQGADKSRFAQLTLRSPSDIPKQEREAHWAALDRDLDCHITPELSRRLIARTAGLIPMIRQAAGVFTRAAARHFDSQRLGDQYGTLLAGAWSLLSDVAPTEAEAELCIAAHEWEVLCPDAVLTRRDPARNAPEGDAPQSGNPTRWGTRPGGDRNCETAHMPSLREQQVQCVLADRPEARLWHLAFCERKHPYRHDCVEGWE
jgi:hypothetical protein